MFDGRPGCFNTSWYRFFCHRPAGWPMTAAHAKAERTEDPATERILADPRRAAIEAEQALAQARAQGDRAAQAGAERALGVAAHVLHDAAAAARYLRQAIRTAQRAGEPVLEAEARM